MPAIPSASFAFRFIPKALFFDRLAIMRVEDRATVRYLGRAGAFVKLTAQRSMRKARKLKLAELPPKLRRKFQMRLAIAKKKGEPRPLLPLAHSKPGEPPRVHMGLLKQHIYYAYDSSSRSVVIGPMAFRGSNVPSVLEYGGQSTYGEARVTIAPRPYMDPALQAVLPRLEGFYEEAFSALSRRAG